MRNDLQFRRRPTGLLLLFCAALWLIAGAVAPAYSDDNFTTLKALIESGQYDKARDFAAHATGDAAADQLNLAFTNALILKVQGHYKEAAAAMRAILSDHPDLTRVRGELADTLYRMGDIDGATYNMQLLADSTSDTTQRSFYDSYLTTMKSKRPWSLDAYVALAPSSNINNGIAGDTVTIGGVPFDATSHEKKSGIGVAYGVAGTYRFMLSPEWDFTVGGKTNGNVYTDQTFDQLNGSVFGELARTTQMWRVGLGVTADRTLFGWNGFNWDVGPQLSVSRHVGGNGTVIGTLGWKYVGYDQEDALNGGETDVGLRYLKQMSPSASWGVGVLFSDVNANVQFNGFRRYRPSIDLYKELWGGLLTSLSVGYEWREYKADYPLTGAPREDREVDVDLAVTFRNLSWRGFAPKVEYTYTHNASNIELNTYDSQAIGFYLTKQY